MTTLRILVLACAAALVVPAVADEARARYVALAIGNDDYVNLAPLRNARADAQDFASVMESKGYEVSLGLNLTAAEMEKAVADFVASIASGDTAVFFYSGHGWARGGETRLVGTDAPAGESEAAFMPVSLSTMNGTDGVVDRMAGKGGALNAAIIDTNRDHPFGSPESLSSRDLPAETFIVYSAGLGQTAIDSLSGTDTNRNGIFMRVFLPHLRNQLWLLDAVQKTRTAVSDLARSVSLVQEPAYYDSTLDRACLFAECRAAAVPVPGGGAAKPEPAKH